MPFLGWNFESMVSHPRFQQMTKDVDILLIVNVWNSVLAKHISFLHSNPSENYIILYYITVFVLLKKYIYLCEQRWTLWSIRTEMIRILHHLNGTFLQNVPILENCSFKRIFSYKMILNQLNSYFLSLFEQYRCWNQRHK